MCERKASPVALTRSSSASFSSSVPSRRKQTSEKWRGAQTSQPGSSRDPALEQLREADVLADHRLQAVAPVAAEHGPELSARKRRPSGTLYSLRLTTSSLDAQVLGDEAERVAQRLRPAGEEGGAVHRGEEPLVRVDADRVGPLPSGEVAAKLRAHGRAARVRGVDVEPGARLGAAVGELRRRGRPTADEVVPIVATTAHAPSRSSRSGRSANRVDRRRPELELEQPRGLRRSTSACAPSRRRRACRAPRRARPRAR